MFPLRRGDVSSKHIMVTSVVNTSKLSGRPQVSCQHLWRTHSIFREHTSKLSGRPHVSFLFVDNRPPCLS